jgi:FkbM family methyltransferase
VRAARRIHSVIDAGAHIGYYALMAAHRLRQVGAGLVFAFEPHPINFADLQRNQQLNNMSNLILIQKAVADQTTQMRLFSSPLSGSGCHSLRQFPFHSNSYEIECTTLDDFMDTHKEAKIGLIKLDVEGAELPALRGAQRLIERDKPYIMYEEVEDRDRAFGYEIKDLRSFLESLGYKIYPVQDRRLKNALAIPRANALAVS